MLFVKYIEEAYRRVYENIDLKAKIGPINIHYNIMRFFTSVSGI